MLQALSFFAYNLSYDNLLWQAKNEGAGTLRKYFYKIGLCVLSESSTEAACIISLGYRDRHRVFNRNTFIRLACYSTESVRGSSVPSAVPIAIGIGLGNAQQRKYTASKSAWFFCDVQSEAKDLHQGKKWNGDFEEKSNFPRGEPKLCLTCIQLLKKYHEKDCNTCIFIFRGLLFLVIAAYFGFRLLTEITENPIYGFAASGVISTICFLISLRGLTRVASPQTWVLAHDRK